MAQQYWIGGFYIDLSRNQITQNKESQTLAPKALSVLTYLAEHQGKVVSQDELMEHVWKDTIVSPNTLQRSIAQLRKALGDDGKVQVYIKTHAKKGYSLECDVRWSEQLEHVAKQHIQTSDSAVGSTSETQTESNFPPHVQANTDSNNGILYLVITIAFIAALVYLLTPGSNHPMLNIGEIRALTATDNKEVDGIYSPDGKYVVFHRYSNEFCKNNIWAKNIETQEEFQLTNNLNSYGAHSFSKDGKSLVFVQSKTCEEPIDQKMCYHLMSLDFEKALQSPREPRTLLECKNSIIRNPKWMNNDRIALLQKSTDRWKLVSYSPTENESETIFRVDNGNVVDYDYTPRDNLLSVITTDQNNDYFLSILTPEGEINSHAKIIYPESISRFRAIAPNFSPLSEQLIFSTGRQLFTLSLDGKVSPISLPLDRPMGTPVLHPNGERMLATKGNFNDDIVAISLNDFSLEGEPSNVRIIERSNVSDSEARFQPNGDLMAFRTQRSGQAHIWISDGEKPVQLSHFPMDSFLFSFLWSDDGKSILANANSQLTKLTLDGQLKAYPLDYPVIDLFDWHSQTNTILANIKINGLAKFAEVNLITGDFDVINDKRVSLALKNADGQIIYTDHMDRFWRQGPLEDISIDTLDAHGSDKGFIIKNNTLFGINEDFQLWRYTLDTKEFTLLGNAPQNTTKISDIRNGEVYLSIFITGKKEIAELLLAN
ncbi:winged helix-turn-helix domain-containing protein [Thalassotalea euphylliae]|uniref:winged helix-turn-helix domain-containing protein n=1 Tax=Thalassotalea euphylliae TaxID=1655234 RepID=UPI00363555C0